MSEFLRALSDPDVPFLRYAFAAGLLASAAFGIVGTYVTARRITYIAGAISHCVLGGIGAALYLQKAVGLEWCRPMYGAVLSALLAAAVIGLVSLYADQREDTVIGALWAVGMAVGLIFIAKTPGYVDPMGYLFGNILLIGRSDLWLIAGLDILTAAVGLFFYNKFFAICFDEEFARLRGVRVELYYMLLLCLTALTIVLLVSVVGVVMVIALLTLPAAAAGQFTGRLDRTMLLSVFFCMFFTTAGLGTSYVYDLPSGPTVIVLAGAVYLTVALAGRFRNKIAPAGEG